MERLGHDTELLQEMVQLFVRNLRERIDGIQEAFLAEDLTRLHEGAHALKGSVANFAAERAWQAVKEVDDLARAGDSEGLAQALGVMTVEVDALRVELEELIKP